MSDLTIVIYPQDVTEGSEEHELLINATRGDRWFNLLGNRYAVTECVTERFSRDDGCILTNKRNKITIKAMKMVPYEH